MSLCPLTRHVHVAVNGSSMDPIVDNRVPPFSLFVMNTNISQISLDKYMPLPPPVEIDLFLFGTVLRKIEPDFCCKK